MSDEMIQSVWGLKIPKKTMLVLLALAETAAGDWNFVAVDLPRIAYMSSLTPAEVNGILEAMVSDGYATRLNENDAIYLRLRINQIPCNRRDDGQ